MSYMVGISGLFREWVNPSSLDEKRHCQDDRTLKSMLRQLC